MKDYEFLSWKELKKSFFSDYVIFRKISELEERMKKLEEKSESTYKGSFTEIPKPFPEEEYKKIQIFTTSDKEWELRKWEKELKFFNRIKKKLLETKTYKNKFVAIKDEKVIDFDIDKLRLAKRVNKKYRDEVVLIVKVEIGVPVAEIPSPEVFL